MITGNTLIELGYKPAKWFSEAIEVANKRNLTGDALKAFIDKINHHRQLSHRKT